MGLGGVTTLGMRPGNNWPLISSSSAPHPVLGRMGFMLGQGKEHIYLGT